MLKCYLHYRQIIPANKRQKQNGLHLHTTLPSTASGFQRSPPVIKLRVVKKGGNKWQQEALSKGLLKETEKRKQERVASLP